MKPEEFVQNLYHQEYLNKQVLFKLIKSKYRDPFEKVLYFRKCYNSDNCLSPVFRFSNNLNIQSDPSTKYYNFFPAFEEFEIFLLEE